MPIFRSLIYTLMKHLILVYSLLIFQIGPLNAQDFTPENFGFRHFQTTYKKDIVDILVLSQKGEEQKRKPILLFGLGSLPKPLIILDNEGHAFGVFPFITDSLLTEFHLAVIGKPSIPLIAYQKVLKNNSYIDPETGISPAGFYRKDYVDYYVDRNIQVIKFLKKKPWVSKEKFIVAGHSASSTVMAKLATKSRDITHLIYSGGNPFGRMITIISQSRSRETTENPYSERSFEHWNKVVEDPSNTSSKGGDSNKTTYDFSIPPVKYLRKIKIPVLATYGTKDYGAPFNDYLRLEMIRERKENFHFIPYIGLEHNFFRIKETGEIDYDQFGWDKVALDWKKWIIKN